MLAFFLLFLQRCLTATVYPEAHLLIIRHGSKHIADYLVRGDWNVRLSTGGEKEADEVAQFLQKYAKAWDISKEEIQAFTSPYKRPQQTAAPWAAATGIKLKVERGLGETGPKSDPANIWANDMRFDANPDCSAANPYLKQITGGSVAPSRTSAFAVSLSEKTFNYPQCDQEIMRHVTGKGASVSDTAKFNDIYDTSYSNPESDNYMKTGFAESGHEDEMRRMKVARKAIVAPINNKKARMVVAWAHKGVVNGLAGWSSRHDAHARRTFGDEYYNSQPWPKTKATAHEADYHKASIIILQKIADQWTFFAYRESKPAKPYIAEWSFPEPATRQTTKQFVFGKNPSGSRMAFQGGTAHINFLKNGFDEPGTWVPPRTYLGIKGVMTVGTCRYMFQKCTKSNVKATDGTQYHMKCKAYVASPTACEEKWVRFIQPSPGGSWTRPNAGQLSRASCSPTMSCDTGTSLRTNFKCTTHQCVEATDRLWCCGPTTVSVSEPAPVEPETSHNWNILGAAMILGCFVGLYYHSHKRKGDTLDEYFLHDFEGTE